MSFTSQLQDLTTQKIVAFKKEFKNLEYLFKFKFLKRKHFIFKNLVDWMAQKTSHSSVLIFFCLTLWVYEYECNSIDYNKKFIYSVSSLALSLWLFCYFFLSLFPPLFWVVFSVTNLAPFALYLALFNYVKSHSFWSHRSLVGSVLAS